MTKQDQSTEIYKTSIDELRRMHDEITNCYREAKTKILTFMGGDLAILSYLYSSGKLFFPKEVYGQIFYIVGLALCIFALTLLFLAIQPIPWTIPTERKKQRKIEQNEYLPYLIYTQETYLDAIENNLPLYEKKQKYLNIAVSSLVIGAVLLLIIKNFSN